MSKRYTESVGAQAYWKKHDEIRVEQDRLFKSAVKIPSYYSKHYADGEPTGCFWISTKPPTPEQIGVGFLAMYHHEHYVAVKEFPVIIGRQFGLAYTIKEYKPPEVIKKWWEIWK